MYYSTKTLKQDTDNVGIKNNMVRKADIVVNPVSETMELMVDNIKMFSKKEENWSSLKLFQFFAYRYGIGVNLAQKLCIYTGHHKLITCSNVKLNHNVLKLKSFFLGQVRNLDIQLAYSMYLRRRYFVKISCYIGLRHHNKYPVRGQRTRSNAKTSKKEPYSFKLKRSKNI